MLFQLRKCYSNFRCGVAPLNIEIGRYSNTPIENRLCNICNENVIEDEKHFLMSCPVYDNLRSVLMDKANTIVESFNELSENEKFIELLSNEIMCKSTARTLFEMFKVRRTFII